MSSLAWAKRRSTSWPLTRTLWSFSAAFRPKFSSTILADFPLCSVCDRQLLSSSADDANCVDPADSLAMLALPPRRTLHRQTQEFELPLLQAPLPETEENQRRNRRKRNKTEQNEEKFLLEPLKKILPSRIRFLNQ